MMKDLMIKLIILTIIAAVLCAGFIYLDNVIVANAQAEDPDCVLVDTRTYKCFLSFYTPIPDSTSTPQPYITYNPPLPETGPYPAPAIEPTPYPAPVTMPFSFPTWFQVILNSIAAWL